MSSHVARGVGLAHCAKPQTCLKTASKEAPTLVHLPTIRGFPLSHRLEHPSAPDCGRKFAVVARAAAKTEKAVKSLTPLEVKETPEENSRV